MFSTSIRTQAINPGNRTQEQGIFYNRMGIANLDQYFYYNNLTVPEMSKWIKASVAGDIVFENIDGVPQLIPGALSGQYHPANAVRVLTSGNVPGIGVTATTAAGIYWFGGI